MGRCRVHRSLGVTPSMESGITDHTWELLATLEDVGRILQHTAVSNIQKNLRLLFKELPVITSRVQALGSRALGPAIGTGSAIL